MSEADGLINIFSLGMKNRPELQLTSQYEITKAIFNPFKPNEVLGATFSGNILQWDMRAKTIPVQKSCLAKNGHKHPIYSLAVVGSQNAHNIVSVSNDGKLCFWSPDNLSEPKIHQQLTLPANSQADISSGINVHTLDFPEEETNSFYVGAEDYNIYQANLHTNASGAEAAGQ
jgi:dynein intermediate chain